MSVSSANSRSTTGAWWHGMFLVLKKFLIKKQNKKHLLFHDAKHLSSHHLFLPLTSGKRQLPLVSMGTFRFCLWEAEVVSLARIHPKTFGGLNSSREESVKKS